MSEDRGLGYSLALVGGAGRPDPFQAMGQFANTLRTMNEIRMQNAEWGARQNAAQIMSSSNNMDEALPRLQQAGLGAYIPDVLTHMAAMNNTMVNTAHTRQTMYNDQMQAAAHASARLWLEPTEGNLQDIANVTADGIFDPEVRASFKSNFLDWGHSMIDGAENNPGLVRMRIGANMLANGVGAEQYNIMSGQRFVQPGGVAVGLGGQDPYGLMPSGVPGQPSPPTAGAGAPGAPGPDTGRVDYTGRPLWNQDSFADMHVAGMGAGGVPVRSPEAQRLAEQFYSTSAGGDLDINRKANATMGNIQEMENDLDQIAALGPGWMQTGPAGALRTRIASGLNFIARAVGVDPLAPTGTIGDLEDLQKIQGRLAFGLSSSIFGQQREAAETVNKVFSAVPGIENTPIGNKLMLEGIKAQVQRQLDQREFESQWFRRSNGDLTGAEDAFNQQKPAQVYTNRALFNATSDFVRKGYISRDTAKQILNAANIDPAQIGLQ